MLDGFEGQQIKVAWACFGDKDSYGNEQITYTPWEFVEDVLIAPGAATSAIEDGRPYGADVVYTLYIPKTYSCCIWRSSKVSFGGQEYIVVGDPRPYPPELTPGSRNIVVEVAAYE